MYSRHFESFFRAHQMRRVDLNLCEILFIDFEKIACLHCQYLYFEVWALRASRSFARTKQPFLTTVYLESWVPSHTYFLLLYGTNISICIFNPELRMQCPMRSYRSVFKCRIMLLCNGTAVTISPCC